MIEILTKKRKLKELRCGSPVLLFISNTVLQGLRARPAAIRANSPDQHNHPRMQSHVGIGQWRVEFMATGDRSRVDVDREIDRGSFKNLSIVDEFKLCLLIFESCDYSRSDRITSERTPAPPHPWPHLSSPSNSDLPQK
jgi:hypothetical protein